MDGTPGLLALCRHQFPALQASALELGMCRLDPSFDKVEKRFRVEEKFVSFCRSGDCRSRIVDLVSFPPAGVKEVGELFSRLPDCKFCSLERQTMMARWSARHLLYQWE